MRQSANNNRSGRAGHTAEGWPGGLRSRRRPRSLISAVGTVEFEFDTYRAFLPARSLRSAASMEAAAQPAPLEQACWPVLVTTAACVQRLAGQAGPAVTLAAAQRCSRAQRKVTLRRQHRRGRPRGRAHLGLARPLVAWPSAHAPQASRCPMGSRHVRHLDKSEHAGITAPDTACRWRY